MQTSFALHQLSHAHNLVVHGALADRRSAGNALCRPVASRTTPARKPDHNPALERTTNAPRDLHPEHDAFRDAIRQFLVKEWCRLPAWRKLVRRPRLLPRAENSFHRHPGAEKFGGGGNPRHYNVILTEEAQRACVGLGSLRCTWTSCCRTFCTTPTTSKSSAGARIATGELMTDRHD